MSSKISESLVICKAFQPIWGTLKPFEESNRPTTPGIRPRPPTETNAEIQILYKEKEKKNRERTMSKLPI